MLIQRIELKGFLSYYGQQDETGEIKPIVIDFSQSSLWLIHGKNGTGKTSLFDAISFALYEKHRGSGTRNNQANYLIHHQAYKDKAEINLEIEIEGQSYLIQRTITRNRRKVKGKYKESSQVWGIVRSGSSINSPAIPNTENAVTEWVEKHLKMNYETFVSSVLLRQGEADAFLKTKPTERKERLLKLLDLEFYKQLGDKAAQKYKKLKDDKDTIEKDIKKLTAVTEAQIQAQEQVITEKDQSLAQIKIQEKQKQQEKDNAQKAADYQQGILDKQEQQQQDKKLIERQELTLNNAREYREIDNGIKQLDSLWEKRERLNKEENFLKQTQENLEKLKIELDELNSKLKKAKQQEDKNTEEFTQIDRRLEQLKQSQNELSNQLKDLEQVERLEKQIEQAEKQLKPHLDSLNHSQEIENKFQRYQELNTGIPLLQKLDRFQQDLSEAEFEFKKSENIVNVCQKQVALSKKEEDDLIVKIDSIQTEISNLQQNLQQYQNKISNLKEKLEHRESVSHAQECPTCGSHLDNPEVQKRLEQECQSWQEQIINFQQEEKDINARLNLAQNSKSEIENNLELAKKKTRELDNKLTRAKLDRENFQKTVAQQQKAVDIACNETGIWLDRFDELSSLEVELQSLKTIPEQKQKLDNARLIENTIKPNLDCYHTELQQLPKFSTEERQKLPSEQHNITKRITECETDKKTIKSELEQAQSLFQDLNSQKTNKESQIYSDQNKVDDLHNRKQQAEQELNKYKNSLSPDWKEHLACENREALEKLRQKLDSLSNAETEENQLQEAQNHFERITGEINTFQELLKKIPIEHRRSLDDIENELEEIEHKIKQIEEKHDAEKQILMQIKNQKQQYKDKQKQLNKVSKEVNYYKYLADAFKELQAKIIQEAQAKIQINANKTLAQLSDGRWQIDLEENDTQTELNIVARDLSQTGTPVQQFEYLSSGEKFIVAVSLAVAIGQSIYGGRTVDSLVIDEGFGTLDDDKRPLMVNELKRLSEDILQGGRVIVVSHQNDVCESFNSSYHVYRDKNHYAQVKQYLYAPC